jgi:hypothetical protein
MATYADAEGSLYASAQSAGDKHPIHVLQVDGAGNLAGTSAASSSYWYTEHLPAANTKATITRAAGATGIRNICTGFTVTLAATSTAPAAVQLTVSLIDGASGGGTHLWSTVISLPATAGAITSFSKTGLWWPGTAATAMTIEFSAAGGNNTIESVSLQGTTGA